MSSINKEVTVTDLQIVNLLEKDYAVRQAKFSAWYRSGGDMGVFLNGYFMWKKSFRGFYSERYLRRSGFLPTTNVNRVVFDDDKLLAYLQSVNPDIISVNSKSVGLAGAEQVSREYMQNNGYNFNNNTETLIYGPNTYTSYEAIYHWQDGAIKIDMIYSHGYETENPGNTVPDMTIVITNPYDQIQTLNASVEYGSMPAPDWFVYIEDVSTVPSDIYTLQEFIMTAIIPIKEDNVFTKETLYMKRFLNKMGLGGDDLVESLTETEDGDPSPIDNAYLMEGLPFDSDNQAVIQTLFHTFEYLSQSGMQVNLSMAELNMSYGFGVQISTIPGDMNEGVDHKNRQLYAVSTITGTGFNSQLTIKYQSVPGEYNLMVVSEYYQRFTISGHIYDAFFDSPPEEGRLIIPLEVLNDLSFRDYVPVHEHSFSLVAYAIETTVIKWYERVIGFVIGIILGVIFGPAGLTIWQLVVNAVVNAVIALGISLVLAAIDNPWITAIVGIIMVLYGQLGSLDLSALTFDNFLPVANSVIDGASGIYADMVKEELEALAKEAEEQAKEDKENMDKLKPGIDVGKIMMDAMYSFEDATNASLWLENQLGTELFNFDQYYNVTKEVEVRKQVVSG